MTLHRFSSRTEKLDSDFLTKILTGASKYLRIAGYFRSSIFDLIAEQIATIPEVKMICNSDLDFTDFQVASHRNINMKEKWHSIDVATDSILRKSQYQLLATLLQSPNLQIRVVPKDQLFLHGKAGVVHYPCGQRKSFIGSVNESKSAFTHNYELIWQDDDEKSADWVEKEFWALWEQGVPLPDVILNEINRMANRYEVSLKDLEPMQVPASAMVESPIYRAGEQLQPWQKSFVEIFLQHREIYGKARLLLADEVGVGKTLSMATSALVTALIENGPILILVPSTLTFQWQIEMMDKIGIPTAIWSSQKKVWLGSNGQILSIRGDASAIQKCPCRIAIVSTGIISHQREHSGSFIKESGMLLKNQYTLVILDEAHKARVKRSLNDQKESPNHLFAFMTQIAKKAKHLILSTATPIQTNVKELWDLLNILNQDAEFVLGDYYSLWQDPNQVIPLITGKQILESTSKTWQWISNPLPPAKENHIFNLIRDQLQIRPTIFQSTIHFNDLDWVIRESWLPECLYPNFFKENNPILRHTVLRKRKQLEDDGLLEKIGVNTHPNPNHLSQYESRFIELAIPTNQAFQIAYQNAEEFSKRLQARIKSAGFMKSLILQRICSSFASGLKTAQKLLAYSTTSLSQDEEDQFDEITHLFSKNQMTSEEIECLKEIEKQLSSIDAIDSKLDIIKWFLTTFETDGKNWLNHGCILFSQYYDTAQSIAQSLSKALSGEVIAVYAGIGKSGLFKNDQFNHVERELIKEAVKSKNIRLVVATDAACEGLNLQTLGTLINIDLPWNPSRLEQRLGRIKRFGQSRKFVDMLNLVYHKTQDQKIYCVLSERLKDTYDLFGSLPDTIDDDWIDEEEKLKLHIDEYIHKRKNAQNAFSLKYHHHFDQQSNLWEKCTAVLSRQEIVNQLSRPWLFD